MIRDITSIILGLAIIVLSFTVAKQGKIISKNREVLSEFAKMHQDQNKIIQGLITATSAMSHVNEKQTRSLLTLEEVDGKLLEAIVDRFNSPKFEKTDGYIAVATAAEENYTENLVSGKGPVVEGNQ